MLISTKFISNYLKSQINIVLKSFLIIFFSNKFLIVFLIFFLPLSIFILIDIFFQNVSLKLKMKGKYAFHK